MDAAAPIGNGAWIRGGLPKESYVKPWQPILLNHGGIVDAFGVVGHR